MVKHGKKYRQALEQYDRDKTYPPEEAIALAKKTHPAKFDETVELHIRTGLDPRHADQQIRGTALLPHGLGKTVRVLVFAEGEGARNALQAGADEVGGDDLIKKVEEGYLEFDVALAAREMMSKVSRLGRVLGPRGLMPNPRSGTVVDGDDIAKAVNDARQGRVEFRLDRTALIHVPIGKVSFDEAKLVENMATLVDAIVKAKPTGTKGQYIRAAALATTMGPGIRLELGSTLAMSSGAN
ncbi:MAG TPA: 50S ribosomal protein L1 [Dehalococcoidia bacterium]|nr:50S ribosomal protein L1 [Dehalococcoidia bacterium]